MEKIKGYIEGTFEPDDDSSGVGIVGIFVFLLIIAGAGLEGLNNNLSYLLNTFPYTVVFYWYLFAVFGVAILPLGISVSSWEYLSTAQFTPFPHIDSILVGAGLIILNLAYYYLGWRLISWLFTTYPRTARIGARIYLLWPFALLLIYYVYEFASGGLGWLFASY